MKENQTQIQHKKIDKENYVNQIFDQSIYNQVVNQKEKYNQLIKQNDLIKTKYFVDKNIKNS